MPLQIEAILFKSLSQFFSQFEQSTPEPVDTQLALAVLLYEVANADMNIDLSERSVISKILMASFGLTETQVHVLLTRAKAEQSDAISMQTYTCVITKNLERQQRIALIQGMWQVAYADGELDGHEEYIIRKVADLIYLNHSDYIKAKLEVIEQHKEG